MESPIPTPRRCDQSTHNDRTETLSETVFDRPNVNDATLAFRLWIGRQYRYVKKAIL
jgi:hypothetical protein